MRWAACWMNRTRKVDLPDEEGPATTIPNGSFNFNALSSKPFVLLYIIAGDCDIGERGKMGGWDSGIYMRIGNEIEQKIAGFREGDGFIEAKMD